jgi:tRNA (guanine-N7-)-methyltransferase
MLLHYSRISPETNFLAIERSRNAAAALAATAAALGLRNVLILAGDARCIVANVVPDASVRAYHVYFPDPWPKRRHRPRRLAHGELPPHLVRTLVPGGVVHVASDLPELVDELVTRLVGAGLTIEPGARPPADRPRTSFERRYAGAGTHYARLRRPEEEGRGPGARLGCDV